MFPVHEAVQIGARPSPVTAWSPVRSAQWGRPPPVTQVFGVFSSSVSSRVLFDQIVSVEIGWFMPTCPRPGEEFQAERPWRRLLLVGKYVANSSRVRSAAGVDQSWVPVDQNARALSDSTPRLSAAGSW